MRIFSIFALLLSLAAFAHAQTPALPYSNMNCEEFEKLTKQENVIILDVRTPEEFAAGHLAGAILVDIKNANFAEKIAKLDKTKSYAVYCRSGKRSVTACEMMAKIEFKHLTNMLGGILDWQKEKRPVVVDSPK